MSYDPREFGAQCDKCLLRELRGDSIPVPPEMHPGSEILLIGDFPGKQECQVGIPFIGPAGQELMHVFNTMGISRDRISITNACLCRPPNDEMQKVRATQQKINRQRKKDDLEPIPSPVDCCRSRLLRDIQGFHNIITLGGTGYRGLTCSPKSVFDIRGGPVTGNMNAFGIFDICDIADAEDQGLKILPTLHPTFVLRKRRWTRVFRADIARALRWFSGKLMWKDPEMHINPPVSFVADFLRRNHSYLSVDIETEFKDRETGKKMISPVLGQARLYCIGFGSPEVSVCVAFLGIDGFTHFYSQQDEAELWRIIDHYLTDPTKLKVMHNAYYDRAFLHRIRGVYTAPVLDTILLHHVVEPEYKHDLGFVGSYYTDVTAWKSDHSGTDSSTDKELHFYNNIDVAVTARILPPLIDAMNLRGQKDVVQIDHKMQIYCQEMHKIGMHVDQRVRQELDDKLKAEAIRYLMECRSAANDSTFNPSSPIQVGNLLYNKWKLIPTEFTKSGAPSTGDDVIRGLLTDSKTPKEYLKGIAAIRWFRRKSKYRGTFVTKLRRCDEVFEEDALEEDEEAEKPELSDDEIVGEAMRRKDKKKRGIVTLDGRLHPHYNAHSTVAGRLSSSSPNSQNFPICLRVMITPEDGHVIISVDKDQLELRAASAFAGAARYLEVFDAVYKKQKRGEKIDKLDLNQDPHSLAASWIFDKEWFNASEKDKKKIRDFAKRFQYSCLYQATVPTIHQTIVSVEDDAGNLIYAKSTERETGIKYDKWLKANPEFIKWWDTEYETARQQGFLAEPLLGRRRDFLDGIEESKNEVINFRCQAIGASVVAIGTIKFIENCMPWYKYGPNTGMINHMHDALYIEIPADKANAVMHELEEAMEVRVPGLDVVFTSEAHKKDHW